MNTIKLTQKETQLLRKLDNLANRYTLLNEGLDLNRNGAIVEVEDDDARSDAVTNSILDLVSSGCFARLAKKIEQED